MTTEARLAFVLFFFAVWCFLGLMAWVVAAVLSRGRGALPALPLALAAAAVAGVAVPLAGGRDLAGLGLSLLAALIAGAGAAAAGIVFSRRFERRPRALDRTSTNAAKAGDGSEVSREPLAGREAD